MRRIIFFFMLSGPIVFTSCHLLGYQRVRGNGHLSVEQRNVTSAERIKLAGSYDVELTQGPVTSVKVEADENLQPYIITDEREGVLEIRTRDHYSLSSNHTTRIFVTTNKLEQVQLTGSGNIIGQGKFAGAEKLTIKIAGSGDVRMEVNTPEIGADIAGSGNITLTGETRDESIRISGVGKYNADGLKAESAKVKIAGSGDVKVFADRDLDINIAGVGSVYYKGAAAVRQKIAGSGEIKRIE